jgi:hypothetical protein
MHTCICYADISLHSWAKQSNNTTHALNSLTVRMYNTDITTTKIVSDTIRLMNKRNKAGKMRKKTWQCWNGDIWWLVSNKKDLKLPWITQLYKFTVSPQNCRKTFWSANVVEKFIAKLQTENAPAETVFWPVGYDITAHIQKHNSSRPNRSLKHYGTRFVFGRHPIRISATITATLTEMFRVPL